MALIWILALAALIFVSLSSAAIPDDLTVSASTILDQIAADKPVEEDGKTIEGSLDLDKIAKLPSVNRILFYNKPMNNLSENKKLIRSPIKIINCTVKGWTNFDNAEFVELADFRNTNFIGHAGFQGAVFSKGAALSSAKFFSYADFLGSEFGGFADFGKSIFYDYADFEGAYFDYANFRSNFGDIADFKHAHFNANADLMEAMFNNTADFRGALFNSDAYFIDTVFKGDAYFVGTTFNITDFTRCPFEKESHFQDTTFTGNTSFKNARFKEDALFENATFDDDLDLTRTRYSKLFIRWHSIEEGGLVYDDAAYMSLMKNFKDLGYYEDYDSCYFAYRQAHRSQRGWTPLEEAFRKATEFLMELFYGYGTKPLNAFFCSLGIVIAFFLYWRWVGLGGPLDKTKESLKDGEEWLDGDLTDILGYSVTVFLSGTRFFIDPPPLPRIEGRSRSMIKKAFILERVLGALFSVLFFIAISGTIVRAS